MNHFSTHASRHHGRRFRHKPEMGGIHRFFNHGRGGRSVRRGNVRAAILAVLRDTPMHGYQVIQELESRTRGRWRPSAGSVYPTLQLLEDEGLVSSQELDGRRTYSLTDAGRTAAEEHPIAGDSWLGTDGASEPDVPRLARSLVSAAMQVMRIGTPEANAAAREVLIDARKRLYKLLAEDDAEPA